MYKKNSLVKLSINIGVDYFVSLYIGTDETTPIDLSTMEISACLFFNGKNTSIDIP